MIKKIATLTLIAIILFTQSMVVWAITVPTAPEAPSAPTAPSAPSAPTSPTINDSDASSDSPQEEDKKEEKESETDTSGNTNATTGSTSESTGENVSTPTSSPTSSALPASSDSNNTTGEQTGNVEQNGATGDTKIDTGNATNTAVVAAVANNNLSTAGSATPSDAGSMKVINSDNGTLSDNSGSATVSTSTNTIQDNSAKVANTLEQTTTTGQNSASQNVGNSTIKTGDANTSGTAITSVNTNTAGVAVSEFTIVDDHIGDIVLDFAANCITGCGSLDALAKNTGNGSQSTNDAVIDQASATNTFQTNDATVGNTLVLVSDSGNNAASENTGGDSKIKSGDANVGANALTFANNNIAGNVVYGVVNIYGDLVGDIIFPEEVMGTCCANTLTAANMSNGAGSDNQAELSNTITDETFQTNVASIENNLLFNATTGNNEVSRNTGGKSSVTTGDTTIDANVLNVANSNVDGGNWWLVLVNQAGQWIGQILGSPQGDSYAGSSGTQFTVNEAGEITAINSDNGSNSDNTASVNQSNTTTSVQTNTASVVNTLDLTANTGVNSASNNTGGNSTIETGDATIIANVVNFVNNNITGGGKLFVIVVNVFGSWIGDFVTPGSHKEEVVLAQASNPQPLPIGDVPLTWANQDPQTSTRPNNPASPESIPASQSTTGTTSQTQAASMSQPIGGFGQSTRAALVAGYTNATDFDEEEANRTVAGRKVISINLAWLLLLVPCAMLWIVRKKFLHLVSLTFKFLPLRKSPAVS